jgi:hypothetical protein
MSIPTSSLAAAGCSASRTSSWLRTTGPAAVAGTSLSSTALAGPLQSESALRAIRRSTSTAAFPSGWQVVPGARLVYMVRDPIARKQSMCLHQVSPGRERRRAEVALLDDRYLGPSRYGFHLAAFLDHFDRSQILVIASEVLRDRPREALSVVFDHLAVDPAVVDLDQRHLDHRSTDKPVPRLHDLEWLPRHQVELHPRWRPDQRTGLARLLTTRRARAGDSAIPPELRDRLAERLAADRRRFEHLLCHQVPRYWRWSTSVSA